MEMKFEKGRIKDLRNIKGMSQAEFARTLETSRQRVAAWEAGECKPNVGALLGICKKFNVEIGYFFVQNNVCVHDEVNT